jgi:hypothetical protein
MDLQLLADALLIRRGQSSDFFDDQPIIESEKFEPYQAWRVQASSFQFRHGHISRPRMVSGSRDHRHDGISALIESAIAQNQRRAPFASGLRAERERDDYHFPLFRRLRRAWDGAFFGRFFRGH